MVLVERIFDPSCLLYWIHVGVPQSRANTSCGLVVARHEACRHDGVVGELGRRCKVTRGDAGLEPVCDIMVFEHFLENALDGGFMQWIAVNFLDESRLKFRAGWLLVEVGSRDQIRW